MSIVLFYDEKKQIMAKVGDKTCPMGELFLGLMFANDNQIHELLGETQPEVIVEGDSAELVEAKKQSDEILASYYNKK